MDEVEELIKQLNLKRKHKSQSCEKEKYFHKKWMIVNFKKIVNGW